MEEEIKNTTREQRMENVKRALGITLSGEAVPTDETLVLIQEYVEGKKELEDVKKEVIERYKRNG